MRTIMPTRTKASTCCGLRSGSLRPKAVHAASRQTPPAAAPAKSPVRLPDITQPKGRITAAAMSTTTPKQDRAK